MNYEEKKLYWEARDRLFDRQEPVSVKLDYLADVIEQAIELGKKRILAQIAEQREEERKEREMEDHYPRL